MSRRQGNPPRAARRAPVNERAAKGAPASARAGTPARIHSSGRSADELAVHERHMARCLELAQKAQGRTAPNPMVGCVIVNVRGQVIAEGYHRRAGEPHAEADALAKLGARAPGCTLYSNLEPCNHRKNRRTSPCAPLIAEAGLARVVIGMGDPIRSHSGGAAWLESQGIQVIRNVMRDACMDLNRPFTTWARLGRPLMVLKAAISLDGKVATRAGDSQWITGAQARRDGHVLRDQLDAIMVGVGTVLADDPMLTVRGIRGGRDPLRIVVDSRLRTPPSARLLPEHSGSKARVIIAASERAPAARQRRLEDAGAEIWRVGAGPHVDLGLFAGMLAQAEITSVLVEGGATLHGALIDAGLADELRLYIAPIVLGGAGKSPAWAGGAGVASLADAPQFRFTGEVRTLGTDLAVRAVRQAAR